MSGGLSEFPKLKRMQINNLSCFNHRVPEAVCEITSISVGVCGTVLLVYVKNFHFTKYSHEFTNA